VADLPVDALSAREREVLEALTVDRATNAEVAARLFISVRTVESHVASLLRKCGVHDRRSLIRLAPALLDASVVGQPVGAPLTSFVGRPGERSLVVEALSSSRLVTVVGAGGSGKTRLALRVTDDVAARYPDRPIDVDLVPVTAADRVPSAIVQRLGLAERGSAEAALASRFRNQQGLVLLDNCEHLGVPLAGVLERLLAHCPGLTVLATSRIRFGAPFETVVHLAGLALDHAVELFAERAASAGAPLDDDDLRQALDVCRALEGLPLAIELAAAQVPAIGLDGVMAALTDPLALLAGGSRAAPRHESVRATLEWSHDLLGASDRALLRRLAVLAVPFRAEVAEAVAADWAPVPAGDGRLLGTLVDASLLTVERGATGTRYRLQEAVRQFAAEQATAAGEDEVAESRLLRWCSARVAALESWPDGAQLGLEPDVALIRSVIERAAARRSGPDPFVAGLARHVAVLLFAHGAPADAQRLHEIAAALASAQAEAGEDLEAAAGAAEAHAAGDASVALRRAAALAWEAAGEPAAAATQLARAAELLNRAPGYFVTPPDESDVEELIEAARRLAGDDSRAAERILTAAAFAQLTEDRPSTAREAAALARRLGDVAGESAALDAESSRELAAGHVARAYAVDLQRLVLLAPVRRTAAIGLEYEDALQSAASCAVALGDLQAARRLALELEALPALAAERHIAVALPMLVETLRGDLPSAIERAAAFLRSWNRAGRPAIGYLSSGAYAVGTAFALAGDDDRAEQWRSIADELFGPRTRQIDFEPATFDLLVLLHRGDWDAALHRAWSPPESQGTMPVAQWTAAFWRPWYTALWTESAVLAHSPEAASRIAVARQHVAGNPVAAAIVDRAAALLARDSAAMPGIAQRLHELDAPYQAARTRVLAGGAEAAGGAAETSDCGAAPMARFTASPSSSDPGHPSS
jgi:predicted ATPase/DNA-binding CsgD family transcriptional regulator